MQKKIFIISVIVIIVLGIIGVVVSAKNRVPVEETPAGQLAQCLKDSGTTFYGAFWCPHCQQQKKLFGRAAKLLPYEECSTADGKGQVQACKDAGIESYPTWAFSDGTRLTGEATFATLAERSSCPLPEVTQS